MKTIVKRIISLACVFALAVSCLPVTPVAAAQRTRQEVQQEIEEKKALINELAENIEANKNNRQKAAAELTKYQQAYDDFCALVDEQEEIINSTEEQLDEKAAQLSETMQSIEDNKVMYTKRLQALYTMNSTNAVLQTLLAVESFSDMVSVGEGLRRISKRDTEMLETLAQTQKDYEEQKEELERTIDQLNQELEEQQANRDWNEEKMAEINKAIAGYNYQIKLDQQETEKTEEEMAALRAEYAAILAALNSKGSQSGDNSVRYDGPMSWPVPGYGRVSSYFGDPRSNTGYHYGIDIPAPAGTPIVAVAPGTVITAGWHYSYGNYIVIDHGQSLRTLYAHCSELWVSGGHVEAGQAIAGIGSTGDSTANHLHFEVHENGGRQNPLASGYLSS